MLTSQSLSFSFVEISPRHVTQEKKYEIGAKRSSKDPVRKSCEGNALSSVDEENVIRKYEWRISEVSG